MIDESQLMNVHWKFGFWGQQMDNASVAIATENKYLWWIIDDCWFNQELQQIRNSLPDSVKIQRVEERLSALGNVIGKN